MAHFDTEEVNVARLPIGSETENSRSLDNPLALSLMLAGRGTIEMLLRWQVVLYLAA